MDNNQCEGYGILALNKVLANMGVSERERRDLIEAFCGEISYLFDTKTEEEAEEQAQKIRCRR